MRRSWWMVVVACALATGGCGDSGEERLAADGYRAEANAICAEGNERADALGEQLASEFEASGEAPSDERLRELLEPLIDDIDQQIDAVRALRGPEDLEADVHAALDDAEGSLDEVRSQIDQTPSAILETDDDPFAEANEQLTALGLDECGAA